MRRGAEPRFNYLIMLVEGLLAIPYSNASIERMFSQLKLTKNVKRLNLKDETLECLMILKNLTRKTKIKDFDSILNFKSTQTSKEYYSGRNR